MLKSFNAVCFFITALALSLPVPGLLADDRDDDLLGYESSHALIVGVADYRGGWSNLPGVIRDVEAVRAALTTNGFTVEEPLLNPTRIDFCRALEKFLDDYGGKVGARLVIYYAGHGKTISHDTSIAQDAGQCPQFSERSDELPSDEQGFLVMSDSPTLHRHSGADSFVDSALRFSAVRNAVESASVNAKHVMVVFDTCFSGSLFRKRSDLRVIYPGSRRPLEIEHFWSQSSRFFITSGTDGQEVPDQSIFRHFLIEGLNGSADLDGDGYVTGLELAMYVRQRVARQSQGSQTPMFANVSARGNVTNGEIVFRSPLGKTIDYDDVPAVPAERPQRFENLGELRDDCPGCPDMIVLPTGRFRFGADEDDPDRRVTEWPQVDAELSSRIAISRTEITNAQWAECFQAGFCDWLGSPDPSMARHPVTGVTYEQAQKYLDWLNAATTQTYRLPTEIEWEFAARGNSTMPRYWGIEPGMNKAHCSGCSDRHDTSKPAEVSAYDPNGFGLHDMLGNVWEWTGSCWTSQPDTAAPIFKDTDENCGQVTIRGGSYATDASQVRVTARAPYPVDRSFQNIGFRVVSELR